MLTIIERDYVLLLLIGNKILNIIYLFIYTFLYECDINLTYESDSQFGPKILKSTN